MQRLLKILATHKYAIIWTIFYVFIMWAILYFMFNFSIFNGAQWHKLARAELHGFGGFVFGLLILSALPTYIATVTLIFRNQKPLITIPIPKITLTTPTKEPEPVAPTPEPTTKTPDEAEIKLPEDLPPELHSVFIRARNHISAYTQSHDSTPTDTQGADNTAPNPTNETFPLPTDFDIQLNNIPGTDDTTNFSFPVFTDIAFDTDTEPETNTAPITPDNKKLTEFLSNQNIPFDITDNIIKTNTHAIITHSDTDFWVIDNENWFANGKTRPSPISKILEFATNHKLIPVIYLESTNIMDLDTHIQSWKSNGIIVITAPEEL